MSSSITIDLGVISYNNVSWIWCINIRTICSCVLRVFHLETPKSYSFSFIPFFHTHHEFCLTMWFRYKKKLIMKVKVAEMLKSRKIDRIAGIVYWCWLKIFNICSLQPHQERYIICAKWKTFPQYCISDCVFNFIYYPSHVSCAICPLQTSNPRHVSISHHNVSTSN